MKKEIEYLLFCLAEEAAEITKVASKAYRFGLESKNPISGLTNREQLNLEINDLMAVVALMSGYGEKINELTLDLQYKKIEKLTETMLIKLQENTDEK